MKSEQYAKQKYKQNTLLIITIFMNRLVKNFINEMDKITNIFTATANILNYGQEIGYGHFR